MRSLKPFRTRLLCLVLPALLLACVDEGDLEQEVLAALEAYVAATNAGDPDRLADLYLDSPSTGSIGDGRISRGWENVSDLLRDFYAQGTPVRMSGEDVVVTPIGPDAAVVYFAARWQVGQETQTPFRGAMTLVFVRTAEGWKVAHDHTSALAGTTETTTVPGRLPGGPPEPVRTGMRCAVTRIVDGDTIDCDPIGRIRLIGVDSPEAGQEPFGDLATEALLEMLPLGSEVVMEPDVEPRDRYGRALGYIWAEGAMVNWAMVREGYALMSTYPPNVQYVDWFRTAQEEARAARVGLWEIDGFECPPEAFRRRQCR